ncbi:MAG: hypothetical protein HXX10_25445 [Rhodoplanes sp.]|nr:hypothetical protein [Rhodoplanes sp.]
MLAASASPVAASEAESWLAYAPPPMAGIRRPAATPQAHADEDEVDTEHIFGITMGSDIGDKGELELELETFSGIGKRFGLYVSTATHTQFKYTVTDNLRIAPGFTFGSHRIEGVPELVDHSEAGLQEASVEIRYKVMDRHKDPFGLTLNFEPGWTGVDPVSGQRVEGYGSVVSMLMDKELIPDKLFGAFNFGWTGDAARLLGTREWTHSSEVAIQGAFSYQIMPKVLVGVETRYLRAYDGLGLDHFRGEALYVGPTFSLMLSKVVGLSGTWNYQVAGKAVGDPAAFDLRNYERNQALLRLTAHF